MSIRKLPSFRVSPLPALALAGTLGVANCGQSESNPSRSDAGKSDAATCVSGPERNGPYTRVTVVGETSTMGIIDPSVEYAAAASTGLMTYTAVPSETQDHIAIATSNDRGASWQFVSNVTVARPITITTTDDELCGSSSCEGTFVQESSSLVLDPFDPDPDRLLKVFAHTYFRTADPDKETPFDLGYIALYTASSAEGPWAETPLLGWPSSSPISNTSVAYDISAVGGLNDCYIVGEPGALVRSPGTIDLALSCIIPNSKDDGNIDIRLLRSVDHGKTWTFVGTLLTAEDAQTLGATSRKINGGDLFYANDAYHLIATPIGTINLPDGPEEGYRGCVVVSVDDLDAGRVARCNGAPVVEASYLGKSGQFVGACSTDEGASASGMLIPVPDLTFTSAQIFQLFASGLPIP